MRKAVAILWMTLGASCAIPPAGRHVVSTPAAPSAIGPYSQAIRVGDTVWVAGQIGLDPGTGRLVEGGIEAETRASLEHVRAILAAAGLSLGDVVETQVFLADLDDFQKMNAVYATFFPTDPPARATVEVAGLPRGARVEILATARRDRRGRT